jgi:hypothetical protein
MTVMMNLPTSNPMTTRPSTPVVPRTLVVALTLTKVRTIATTQRNLTTKFTQAEKPNRLTPLTVGFFVAQDLG